MNSANKNFYINDNGFVFDYVAGTSYHFNETGLFVFKKLLAGTTQADIITELESTYGVSHDIAAADISDFRQQLYNLELITSKAAKPHD